MEISAQNVVRLFKAETFRTQLEALADRAAQTVRVVSRPGMDVGTLAQKVVAQILRQDKDGGFLGTVYNDQFDRESFVKALTRKLTPHVSAGTIAEEILLELENQK